MEKYITEEWSVDGVEVVSQGSGFVVCRLPARFADLGVFINNITSECSVAAVDSEISSQGGLQLRLWGGDSVHENAVDHGHNPPDPAQPSNSSTLNSVNPVLMPTASTITQWRGSILVLLCAVCMAVWRLYGDAILTEFHFYTARKFTSPAF